MQPAMTQSSQDHLVKKNSHSESFEPQVETLAGKKRLSSQNKLCLNEGNEALQTEGWRRVEEIARKPITRSKAGPPTARLPGVSGTRPELQQEIRQSESGSLQKTSSY